MTTGTPGDDDLSNDPSVADETVDAQAGDDWITIVPPDGTDTAERKVAVLGGAGYDALFIDDQTFSAIDGSGFGGTLHVSHGSYGYDVAWSSVERLELSGWIDADSTGGFTTGDSDDILTLFSASEFSSPTIVTNGGDDDIALIGEFYAPYVDGGAGDDVIDFGWADSAPTAFLEANGGAGHDILVGGYDSNSLSGDGGDDLLLDNQFDDRLSGGAGNDILFLDFGGDDDADGDAGHDLFYFGGAFTAMDRVDGGADGDLLILQGDYEGPRAVSLQNVTSIEALLLLSGSDTSFGGSGGDSYSYDIRTSLTTVAAGRILEVDASELRAGENLTFDGSIETDGAYSIWGGQGVDTLSGGANGDLFLFGTGSFAATDHVNGGGGVDQLTLHGDYFGARALVFQPATMTNVERLVLASGHNGYYGPDIGSVSYNLIMDDAGLAAGQGFTVNAGGLGAAERFLFSGRFETDGYFVLIGGAGRDVIVGGRNSDTIVGGLGSDSIQGGFGGDSVAGGGGVDTFIYGSAYESSGLLYDKLIDFSSGEDRLNLRSSVSGWAGAVTHGPLTRAHFNADLAAALNGPLGPNQAVLFTPDGGDFAGKTFLVVDGNGDGAYQQHLDYVFLVGAGATIDTSSTSYFI
jgi:peptidase M10/serralysin-like protein/hemolysin type calcium-binding protein